MPRSSESRTEPLERERELEVLRARLDAALDEREGSVVGLVSPAGTGKSTLLDVLVRAAAPRAQVLTARGLDVERDRPFAVVRQLVEGPLLALDPATRAELLAAPASPVGALLERAVDAPVDSPGAVAHGVYWLLARMAERRALCVVVDDLQWADRASAEALAYVARRVEGHPLLLAFAAREGEDEAAGSDGRGLLGAPGVVILQPQPLGPAAAARLIDRRLGADDAPVDPAFTAACHQATAGNPRLLAELLEAWAEDGLAPDAAGAERVATLAPERVARLVVERIARLGDDAMALARAVAILERGTPADAAALADLDPGTVDTVADRLIAAGVLADEVPLRFAHPLSAASVTAELTSTARDRAHRRAAAVLADRDREAAALHLLRCAPGKEAWAAQALSAAADDALARGDPGAAVRLLDRAVAEGDQLARARRVPALLAAGDPRAVDELRETVRSSSSAPGRLRAMAQLAQAQFTSGDPPGCLATLRAGLDEAEQDIEPGGATDGRADFLVTAALLGQADPQIRARADAAALCLSGDPRLAALATVGAFCRGEPAGEHVPAAVRALRALSGSSGTDVAPAFHVLVWALAGYDQIAAADAALEDAFALARERGSRLRYGMACYVRTWVRWRSGDVMGTLADVEETLAFAVEGGAVAEADVRWVQAECLLLRGDLDGAERALVSGLAAVERVGWSMQAALLRHGRAALRLRTGDAAGALDDALAAGKQFAAVDIPTPAVADWRGRGVRAALRLDRDDVAAELAADAVRRAEVVGTHRALALAGRADALIRPPAERIERLRAAEAHAAQGPSPVVRAAILLDLGAALRRERRPRDAREPLLQAADLARRAGATALAIDATAELEATGARRRRAAWGVEALTPREHELAALARDGLSNTQIAERLFITRKTVETHLMAVFRKLGVQARDELATALDATDDDRRAQD